MNNLLTMNYSEHLDTRQVQYSDNRKLVIWQICIIVVLLRLIMIEITKIANKIYTVSFVNLLKNNDTFECVATQTTKISLNKLL